MIFSFSYFDEDSHDFIQFIQSNNLISIRIEEVENSHQIIFHVSTAKHVEQN